MDWESCLTDFQASLCTHEVGCHRRVSGKQRCEVNDNSNKNNDNDNKLVNWLPGLSVYSRGRLSSKSFWEA